MKRFGHNGSYGSKIGKFVEYSHALTMEPYLLAKEGETCVAGREDLPLDKKLRSLLPRIAKEPERTQYKLSAVVCHKGSTIYRGHYTCFVQGANKLLVDY